MNHSWEVLKSYLKKIQKLVLQPIRKVEKLVLQHTKSIGKPVLRHIKKLVKPVLQYIKNWMESYKTALQHIGKTGFCIYF